jgi:hypothetical protein
LNPRRAELTGLARELDLVAARAWPCLEEARLGEWRLRFSNGVTKRSNSVLPLGPQNAMRPGGCVLAARIAAVELAYAKRGLPSRFQVTELSSRTIASIAGMVANMVGCRRPGRRGAVSLRTRDIGPNRTAHTVRRMLAPGSRRRRRTCRGRRSLDWGLLHGNSCGSAAHGMRQSSARVST